MRPIDADELRELYELDGHESYFHVPCEVILQNIDDMPTIEPKRGEWVKGMQCSECGQVDLSKPNFCPNCGADMRGEEDGTNKVK